MPFNESVSIQFCTLTGGHLLKKNWVKMLGELLVIIITLIAYAIYKCSANARYFKERNLKYVGISTGVKNLFDLLLSRKDILEMSQKMYDTFPDEP